MSAELLFLAGMLGMIAGLLPFAIYEIATRSTT